MKSCSAAWYAPHSELTKQKLKKQNFYKELEHLIWKYKN